MVVAAAEEVDEVKKRLERIKRVQEKKERKRRRLEADERYDRVHTEWLDGASNWDDVVEAWTGMAEADGELGGMPYPADVPLVLERRFPYDEFQGAHDGKLASTIRHENQQTLAYELWEEAGRPEGDGKEFWFLAGEYIAHPEKRPPGRYIRLNGWYSERLRGDITIWHDTEENKIIHRVDPDRWEDRMNILVRSNHIARIWSLRAEQKAQEKIKRHLNDKQYRSYMLTGSFFEDSKRTKLHYMFRRMRPTVVFSPRKGFEVLCALCMHGTGYYQRTWTGVLSPTDDVLIHLFSMRTDEYGYWKKANQHPPHSCMSGV